MPRANLLVIREEQMGAFAGSIRRAFCVEAAKAIEQHWPKVFHKLGEAEIYSLSGRTIDEGGRFGIYGKVDLLRFLNIVVALGERFYEAPEGAWAADILRSHLRPETRLDLLRDQATLILRQRS